MDIDTGIALAYSRMEVCKTCLYGEKHDLMGDVAVICKENGRIINFYARDKDATCPVDFWQPTLK